MSTQFVSAGTLPRPGVVGRLIRLGLGVAILFSLIPFLFQVLPILSASTEPPIQIGLWVTIVIGVLILHYVVNLGLGRNWGYRPQIVLAGLIASAVILDLVIYSSFWAPPLGWLIFTWLIVEFLPLGLAYVLAAILATPGCEMRAYNHLVSKVLGQDPTEHFCPGGVDLADRW